MFDRAESGRLTRVQLLDVLAFCDACLHGEDEASFHEAIRGFAARLGFEFVLYAYMPTAYRRSEPVRFVNLSNPPRWMEEYHRRGFLQQDPVRAELERRLALGVGTDCFRWDSYDRDLTAGEREVVARRAHYGLRVGCSAFCNSARQDSIFLISLASSATPVRPELLTIGKLVVPHLNRARKRLDLRTGVVRLTRRERAVADWLLQGKSNGEIAEIMGVTPHTVKFHVARIYDRLAVNSRQAAVAVLLAERFL